MKIKTTELTGSALDWAVAKCEGKPIRITSIGLFDADLLDMDVDDPEPFSYSTSWKDGGPIIERGKIAVAPSIMVEGLWVANVRDVKKGWDSDAATRMLGQTPLIAAMRCYVASKLGEEVEVPEELI